VQGWDAIGLGRLYRLYDPELVNSGPVLDTKRLIAEGMENRPPNELESLLSHPDQRVRQEAQFELVRGALADASSDKYRTRLLHAALVSEDPLARLHAIWGLGQIGRVSQKNLGVIEPLLEDNDAEVRAQTAKVFGDARFARASESLIKALGDSISRVRFFAAIALGNIGDKKAVAPLLAMLRENADKDPFLRHAGVMGLVGTADPSALVAAATDNSRSVRMGVLLAMRRLKMPEVALFLRDADPLIVLEAARAINDVPINDAMPQLASLIDHSTQSEPLDWRVINANFRVGGEKNAAALADYAAQTEATEKVRVEALHALETWGAPGPRDRVTGFWRPLPERDGRTAAEALKPAFDRVLASSPDAIQLAAIRAAQKLSLTNAASTLLEVASNTHSAGDVRVAALETLGEFHDSRLVEAAAMAKTDHDENVREEGNRLFAQINPGDAVKAMASVLEMGTVKEKQGALATLGAVKGDATDKLLAEWLDKLLAGAAAREIQLDILSAATNRDSVLVKEKLSQYETSRPEGDEFAGYRETLYGGNAEAGRKIFMERPDASCVRCHRIHGKGGDVGPDLAGIITRHDREYILESMLFPNKQIAPGFESLIVQMNDGRSFAGVVKKQTDQELTLITMEENDPVVVKLKQSDIKKKVKGLSAMPEGLGKILSKQDIRNLVEFLATLN
jgi:quinoprotein glucose dehydrogenase